ncbi:MBL fold metallo-hydrolase [Psychrobacter sp. I-STPA10]|uniref:MBL fold metallo-hydrolase n=1 Tax=Psychrobacter sp. I-STPA10 TaxID=2585769 RepID=UPI001E4FF7C2|nr:MBL fold metallo-hydrolase [Psychrobacter sp. I-STPA10]
MKHHVLFDDGNHKCIAISIPFEDESIPSNQFLIIDGEEAAILDPGGDLTFAPLTLRLSHFITMEQIRYVIGSHQDPDILASMPRWLVHTEDAKLIMPSLWQRFLPHYNSAFTRGRLKQSLSDRIIGIPDTGGYIPLGSAGLIAIPAHFLHSVGNLQFYDPVSGILFSGDMGASLAKDSSVAVTDFDNHISNMIGFHRRYMVSKKVTSLWAQSVRQLDVRMMLPQHGMRFDGTEMFHQFLDWISELDCGIDLFTAEDYACHHLLP